METVEDGDEGDLLVVVVGLVEGRGEGWGGTDEEEPFGEEAGVRREVGGHGFFFFFIFIFSCSCSFCFGSGFLVVFVAVVVVLIFLLFLGGWISGRMGTRMENG